MDNLSAYCMLCLTSTFTLMNPLGVMPVFLEMTDGLDDRDRRRIAMRSCLIAFVILLLFTLSGKLLFEFFGISTDSFRIVGGIIIFKIGYDMLQAHFTHINLNDNERRQYSENITVTPLAVPMLCGPGAIANSIALMQDAADYRFKIALIGAIALVCVLAFLILCASTRLLRFLGQTGNNVMMRLMGLLLMVIAVECFVRGASPILTQIIRQGTV